MRRTGQLSRRAARPCRPTNPYSSSKTTRVCARRWRGSSRPVATRSRAPAAGGQEGWEYLERGGCASVLVLDILMPRLDGRLFRKKQLERKECASIPVVVFTATQAEMPDAVAVIRKTDPQSLL